MILIRNSPHNNGVFTFFDNKNYFIIKSSFNILGGKNLQNEFDGYTWYFNQFSNNSNPFINLTKSNNYIKIKIKFFDGITIDYSNTISKNYLYIVDLIKEYARIWPKNENQLCPIHGDFSLGNIIYTKKNSIYIIDWEHFRMDFAIWGFDILNLIYESIYFSFKKNDFLTKSDKSNFINILILLKHTYNFNANVDYAINFIQQNKSNWGELINKLPILKFNNKQLQYIRNIESQIN